MFNPHSLVKIYTFFLYNQSYATNNCSPKTQKTTCKTKPVNQCLFPGKTRFSNQRTEKSSPQRRHTCNCLFQKVPNPKIKGENVPRWQTRDVLAQTLIFIKSGLCAGAREKDAGSDQPPESAHRTKRSSRRHQ